MRYIHDGALRDTTIDPPPVFVFDESQTPARGRTNTAALMASILAKQRRLENRPLCIGHEDKSEWRWSE
ncbi:hypothetical protein [Natronosalvus rutilus]|uniref:Uncharacterized protein n=1 Tax=Natronosalvus rutilus TaxID=2953753 RepID=A0A9E7N9M4_9EURY|nr:hypothetical protein [Natronosalvus rutilus]UTF52820.1 hypothetical protein NGM29_13665 [Natronosalvus rutilus]